MNKNKAIDEFIEFAIETDGINPEEIDIFKSEIKNVLSPMYPPLVEILLLYVKEAIKNSTYKSVSNLLLDLDNKGKLNIFPRILSEYSYLPCLFLGYRQYLTFTENYKLELSEHKIPNPSNPNYKLIKDLDLISFGVKIGLVTHACLFNNSFKRILKHKPSLIERFILNGNCNKYNLNLYKVRKIVVPSSSVTNMCDVKDCKEQLKVKFIKATEEFYFSLKTDKWNTYCIKLAGYDLTKCKENLIKTLRYLMCYILYIQHINMDLILDFDDEFNIISAYNSLGLR